MAQDNDQTRRRAVAVGSCAGRERPRVPNGRGAGRLLHAHAARAGVVRRIARFSQGALGSLIAVVGAITGAADPVLADAPDFSKVPGIVIDHSPKSSGLYIGSPGLAVLPNGDYLASHDFFGPKSAENQKPIVAVFRSQDRGRTWKRVARLEGLFWPSLFEHRGAAYLLGPDRGHGKLVIRRSIDGGETWTEPRDGRSGLLTAEGQYHTAPVPVVAHNGRLWRATEDAGGGIKWGERYSAFMLSAPEDADLLNAGSWTLSNAIPRDAKWLGGRFGAWLEGNAVVTRDGGIVNMLRVETPDGPEQAAIIEVSPDGRTARFDPATGFVEFPGGAKKFTIRYDEASRRYWSIASIVLERYRHAARPGAIRNTLALTCSPDLRTWEVRCILLHHPDTARHGFQYVDWHFDGDDLIAACRTAYDDGLGGANNYHDANFLTFHRITNFRGLAMKDSVPIPEVRTTRLDAGEFEILGDGFEPAVLADGQKAFSNRTYVWNDVPERFRGWTFTRKGGGERPAVRLKAKAVTTVWVATAEAQRRVNLTGWERVGGARFSYTDADRTAMVIYRRDLKAGEEIHLPQSNWSGVLVLFPPAPSARTEKE